MNCEEYRKKYPEFTKWPLASEICESDEFEPWQNHGLYCESCIHWDLQQRVIQRGYKISDFPCVHIAYRSTMTCEDHQDPWECPDMTIVKIEDNYGIPVRDGGASYIKIDHCPWCGIQLSA